jgi:hypothetical protein
MITIIGCAGALGTGLAVASPGRAAVPTATAVPRAQAERYGGPADPPDLPLAERNRTLAAPLTADHGWSTRQWRCLDRLWTRESRWNHLARNRWSGAYGIPQALPAGKMRSAGTDWRTSAATQIRWGLGYIERRYGSPCAAWGHSQAAGWY